MFAKAILFLTFVFSVLFLDNTPVPAQTPQPQRRQMPDLSLPKLVFPAGKAVVEVPFETEGNWVVIPLSVNGSRPLRYVLDTGAQGTTLYGSNAAADSLNLKISGSIQMRGAGGGGTAVEVPIAENVNFNIGGIELSGGSLALRNSPPRPPARALRDGVIGRIIFGTLVVEIDWERKTIKFYDPAKYKYSGSGAVLPLTFDEGGRPYATANVVVSGDKKVSVKLVVDTGGSHALLLDVGSKPEITLPAAATKTVLGRGASGEITGYIGRVESFEFGGQTFKNVPTIFPDASSGTAGIGGRQGNLGSGILRRFKIIYDYTRKQIIVEPNRFANEAFAAPTANRNIAANTTQASPAAQQDYVGRYGDRTIVSEGGALHIQRPGGPKLKLVPVAANEEFTLEAVPDARIKFIRDAAGKVNEIQVLNREGQWENSKKEQSKIEPPAADQPNNQSPNEQPLSQAEQEVRKLEREWLDAYEKRDAQAMNRILADDFKLTFSNGSVQTKADVLAQLKTAQDANRSSPKFSTEDVQSRVEGDTVILTGRVVQTTERDGQTRTMQMRYTDTYAKRNGRWQIIVSQLTRIQQ